MAYFTITDRQNQITTVEDFHQVQEFMNANQEADAYFRVAKWVPHKLAPNCSVLDQEEEYKRDLSLWWVPA